MNAQFFIQKLATGLLALSLLASGALLYPTVAQAATVQAADPEIIYLVQHGDTLYAIAKRYGVTVQELINYNGLASTTIYVGQRLLIPVANSPQGPSEPITYVVQPSDTLSGIARRYNSTVQAIKQSNELRGDTIYVGQRLRVPVSTNVPNPPPPTNTVERIQFRSGATSDTRGGTVSAIEPKRYVLWAAAGQQMTVQLKTNSLFVNFNLFTPSGENLAINGGGMQTWSGILTASGDYTIEVRHSGTGLADFGITVTINNSDNGSATGSTVLAWQLGQDFSQKNVCRRLTVLDSGYASAEAITCEGQEVIESAGGWLTSNELTQLNAWLYQYAPFYLAKNYINGKGTQPMGDDELLAIYLWAVDVRTRLWGSAN